MTHQPGVKIATETAYGWQTPPGVITTEITLNLPLNTVRSHLYRGRQKLAVLLEE